MRNIFKLFELLLLVEIVSSRSVEGDFKSNIASKRNVLLIIADDLRPEIGAFFDPNQPYSMNSKIHTPSLNWLAACSLQLRRAYAQQAICAPSRVSFLTSRRPDTTKVYTIQDIYWRKVAGDLTTIPQYFKNQGYRSVGMGKIFHHGSGSNQDDPPSWSEEYYHVPKESRVHWYNRSRSWNSVSPEERKKIPLPDDYVADHAIDTIRRLGRKGRSGEEPFFMAVGFYKPHLPFVFPQQYLDLYPNYEIPSPRRVEVPHGMPDIAWNNWEINKYPDIAELNLDSDDMRTTLPVNVSRALRRAYYCAVSYVDDLVGRILWEMDTQGLLNNTVIAFLGDHGWHLGENNLWGKHTNFELSTRAPFMVRIPGLTDRGYNYDKPVEFVDLFPTLVEAAGFEPMPICPEENSASVELCTEGSSLVEILRRPPFIGDRRSKSVRRSYSPPLKEVAFSQYPRRGFSVMGYSVRTENFRYTEWIRRKNSGPPHPKWRIVYAAELYDHEIDPDETINLADDVAYASLRRALGEVLQAGWRGAMFPNETIRAGRRQKIRLASLRPTAGSTLTAAVPTSVPGPFPTNSNMKDALETAIVKFYKFDLKAYRRRFNRHERTMLGQLFESEQLNNKEN